MAQDLDLRLYLVTDPTFPDLVAVTAAAVAGGVTCVQVRDKACGTSELTRQARELRAVLPPNVAVVVNDDLDAARVVDGIHVGVDDLPPALARAELGPDAIVGWSINDVAQLDDLTSLAACDYVAASPVWATPTKPDASTPFGIDGVRQLAQRLRQHPAPGSRVPLVAIGGITHTTAGEVVAAGADGIAVVSAIGAAPDPRAAARALRAEIDTALALRLSGVPR